MIEIEWREDRGYQCMWKPSEFINIKVRTAGGFILASGVHPGAGQITRTVARMYNVPPEERDYYKQVLADLIQARYGVKDVEIR